MMILLTLCTLYVFWEREEKKEWNCSLVPFCTLSFPTYFLLSSLLRFLVKDDMWQQAKIPVNKRASPSLPTVCFRAAGKTLRFKSSRSPERVLTGISDCRSRKRKCVRVYVCTRVLKTASVIQTHTHTNITLEKADSSLTVARARAHTREQMPCSYHQTQSNAPASCLAIASFLFPLTGS